MKKYLTELNFELLKAKIFFTEMFHESLKTVQLEFNVEIQCEINV